MKHHEPIPDDVEWFENFLLRWGKRFNRFRNFLRGDDVKSRAAIKAGLLKHIEGAFRVQWFYYNEVFVVTCRDEQGRKFQHRFTREQAESYIRRRESDESKQSV